jgi:uncharacterized phage protein (TIGR01671 family)
MREIKFRGRSFDNGEWVYGDYHKRAGGVHCIIKMEPDKNGKVVYAVHQAVPDTIGQFTGLHDKNGKEIYEGDILVICEYENMLKGVVCEESEHELFTLDELKGELRQQYKSVIHYEDCTLFASEQDGCDIYLASLAGDMRKSYPIFEYEVIGNIHDNPELLNK